MAFVQFPKQFEFAKKGVPHLQCSSSSSSSFSSFFLILFSSMPSVTPCGLATPEPCLSTAEDIAPEKPEGSPPAEAIKASAPEPCMEEEEGEDRARVPFGLFLKDEVNLYIVRLLLAK
jgi:hypothetical protein